MIKDATFTSVWDGGVAVTTNCKVNLETREVFDIEPVDIDGVDTLDEEYVTIDGKNYSTARDAKDDPEFEYWYE